MTDFGRRPTPHAFRGGLRSFGAVLATFVLCAGGCASSPDGGPSPGGGRRFWGPRGSPWTIQCLEFQGPNRLEHIEQFAESFKRTDGINAKDVYVVDDSDGCARLYYGTYYRRTDSKTGKRSTPKRLLADLKLIKQLGAGSDRYYFAGAMVVRQPTPDVGNPEWALSRADGDYTVQVAAFEPTDEFWDFKKAAAQCCAALRDAGYEAYYHHSHACSVVTVGAFGKDAITTREVMADDYRTVQNFYSDEVNALLHDETLRYHHVNGTISRVRAESGEMTPVPSRLVAIPRKKEPLNW